MINFSRVSAKVFLGGFFFVFFGVFVLFGGVFFFFFFRTQRDFCFCFFVGVARIIFRAKPRKAGYLRPARGIRRQPRKRNVLFVITSSPGTFYGGSCGIVLLNSTQRGVAL